VACQNGALGSLRQRSQILGMFAAADVRLAFSTARAVESVHGAPTDAGLGVAGRKQVVSDASVILRRHAPWPCLVVAFALAACHSFDHSRRRGTERGSDAGGTSLDLGSGGADWAVGGTPTNPSPAPADVAGGHAGESHEGVPGVKERDTTPPRVLASLPQQGALAVSDGNVVITFSEPMDPASFRPTVLGAHLQGTSWNERGDVLTLHCDLPSFTEPPASGERLDCQIEVPSSARDVNGNEMAQEFRFSFSPVAYVTQQFYVATSLRGHAGGTYILAGDTEENIGHMGLITFVLETMPDFLEIQKATMRLNLRRMSETKIVTGDPLGDLGRLHLEHALFSELSTQAYADSAKLGELGVVLGSGAALAGDQPFEMDVTEAVAEDLDVRDARRSFSQYRLRFDRTTNDDKLADQIMFWNLKPTHPECHGACDSYQVPTLTVSYTVL
jgi:hypothetical protein